LPALKNITCHYSEQKPMGRPRKRQFVEAVSEDLVPVQSNVTQGLGQLPFNADDTSGYNDSSVAEPYYINKTISGMSPQVSKDGRSSTTGNGRVIWHFGDREVVAGPPINFGDIDIGSMETEAPQISDAHTLSATTSNLLVTRSENSSPQSIPSGPCSCLASMYLALSSLQVFPNDIVLALKTVRGAASVAARSIWCPQCGSVVLESPDPPIEAFQNTMLLGTILPIIANGYQRLLKMIDHETDIAVTTSTTKTFRFHDYGGLCGKQDHIEAAITCFEKEIFFNAVEMPPQQWRQTVRALLRVDIYGHEQSGFKHKGLKDLVAEMEQRQIARHELLDAWEISGRSFGTMHNGAVGGTLCGGEQNQIQPPPLACMQILQVAKAAIDSLVIA